MSIRFAVVLGALLVACPAAAQIRPAGPPLLVSTTWLADHLRDPNVVVLETSQTAIAREQIPGAQHVPHDSLMTMGASHDLAGASDLVTTLERAGVSNSSHVVIYGEPLASGWLFFALDYLGHERTSLLDGGLDKWKAEGRPVSAVGAPPPAGHFQPQLRPEVKASAETVHNRAAGAVAVLDARSAKEYVAGIFPAHNCSRGRTFIRTRSSRCSRVPPRSRRCLQLLALHPARLPSRTAKSACGPASCISRLDTRIERQQLCRFLE